MNIQRASPSCARGLQIRLTARWAAELLSCGAGRKHMCGLRFRKAQLGCYAMWVIQERDDVNEF
ncbi:TPA: hypothetical protein ACK3Q6_002116 [Burkholderia cepacia]|uniref:hypothetical protein n=1 Tax=Burkholderia cepacia TaxID=292 RepID=UPI001CF2241C|nr:hypothetical protein [Burkholderia cepacia]MCA8359735.1 hypothetical protein [Burkholderia cepacia]HDR9760080.1 hypothetical protein [Burkholderia cepacia ATCC 25416]HDV6370906.1 hypothetical protein [Burkholderia cepacia]